MSSRPTAPASSAAATASGPRPRSSTGARSPARPEPCSIPIFALRRRLRLEPGETARVDFWTMAADSREAVLGLVDKHHDAGAFERAAALAWTQVQVQLHHLGINRSQAGQFQRLAGHVLFAAPTLRPASEIIQAGRAGQPLLWGLGISGDLPIVLVRISDTHQLGLVARGAARRRVLAHAPAGRRPGDPERTRVFLHPGSAGGARDAGPREPVQAAGGRGGRGRATSSCCAPTWCRRKCARCWARWRAWC